jgi:hypothetical protein
VSENADAILFDSTIANNDPETIQAEIVEIIKKADKPWPVSGTTPYFDFFNTQLENKYGLRLWDDLFKVNSGYVSALAHRDGIPPDKDWNHLIAAIQDVVGRKDALARFQEGLVMYISQLQLQSIELVQRVAEEVNLTRTPSTEFIFPIGAVFNLLFAPLALIPVVGGFTAGIAKGIIEISLTSWGNGGDPFEEKFKSTLLEYRKVLGTKFNLANRSLVETFNKVYANYGKLLGVNALINRSGVKWPQNIPDIFTDESTTPAEVEVWKTLLPARWPLVEYSGSASLFLKQDRKSAYSRFEFVPWARLFDVSEAISVDGSGEAPYEKPGAPYGTLGVLCALRTIGEPHIGAASAFRLFSTLGADPEEVFGKANKWNFEVKGTSGAMNFMREDSIFEQGNWLSNGMRVKVKGADTIYMMLSGVLRGFTSPKAYENLFKALGNYREGAPITEENTSLIGANDSVPVEKRKTYLRVDGRKRLIASPEVFDRYNFSWQRLKKYSLSELNAIPDGLPILY